MLRAYLQLLRLPNVFTAMADVMLGWLLTHASLAPWWQFGLLLAASSLVYLAGMVLNDYFDRRLDAVERPERPIPSGRVPVQLAGRLGFGMLLLGVVLAWAASLSTGESRPAAVATILAAMVLAYNGLLKRTLLGALAMGACRLLNVLLGASLAEGAWHRVHWLAAAGIGVYVMGVTIFARREERTSPRPQLILGAVVMLAGIGLLGALPRAATGTEWPPIHAPMNWNLFWALIAGLILWRSLWAIVSPSPRMVQAAVKSALVSIIVLDAGTSLAVHEPFWALAILTLLVPCLFLGRWIYST